MTIINKEHKFIYYLDERLCTDLIVIHHTGSNCDTDLSAEEIHRIHKEAGYAGIGYHYVVRKSGAIEIGRPEWAVGAHCYSFNTHSVGIHLSGNFNIAYPTIYQIEATAELIADISRRYGFKIDSDHIKAHRDLNSTDCPGKNLYADMDLIRGKANWYYNKF